MIVGKFDCTQDEAAKREFSMMVEKLRLHQYTPPKCSRCNISGDHFTVTQIKDVEGQYCLSCLQRIIRMGLTADKQMGDKIEKIMKGEHSE